MEEQTAAPVPPVENLIFLIRGYKVMLSGDLAGLYGVEPKVLIQAVKRNMLRLPSDFVFQLNDHEFANLKSQIVTSSWGGLRRANPYAFTEQGVAMLSSVLRSPRAIQANIAIMRVFVKFREALALHKELVEKLRELESRVAGHDERIEQIFEAIRKLMAGPDEPPRKIGFQT